MIKTIIILLLDLICMIIFNLPKRLAREIGIIKVNMVLLIIYLVQSIQKKLRKLHFKTKRYSCHTGPKEL